MKKKIVNKESYNVELLKDISILKVEDGDVIVVIPSKELSHEMEVHFEWYFKEVIFKNRDVKLLLLRPKYKIVVLRKENKNEKENNK